MARLFFKRRWQGAIARPPSGSPIWSSWPTTTPSKPSADLYVTLRDAYAAIGQFDRAAAACQRAIRLKPQDKKLLDDLKQLQGQARRPPRPARPDAIAEQACAASQASKERRRSRVQPDGEERREAAGPDRRTSSRWRKPRRSSPTPARRPRASSTTTPSTCTSSGLGRAPDALEEGHLPLCELGLQRRGKGGKKPSMMEKVKRMRGKSPLEQMLNAEYLFVKDPDNLAYAEAMLKAAVDGGFSRTAHWIANLIFQTNNALEKPSLQTYLLLKDSYKALGQYDKAVAACQRAYRMKPDSKELADEYKNLSAELTMSKGKYGVRRRFPPVHPRPGDAGQAVRTGPRHQDRGLPRFGRGGCPKGVCPRAGPAEEHLHPGRDPGGPGDRQGRERSDPVARGRLHPPPRVHFQGACRPAADSAAPSASSARPASSLRPGREDTRPGAMADLTATLNDTETGALSPVRRELPHGPGPQVRICIAADAEQAV